VDLARDLGIEQSLTQLGVGSAVAAPLFDWNDGFPGYVLSAIPPDRTMSLAQLLRAGYPTTGLWPLIVDGETGDLNDLADWSGDVAAGSGAVAASHGVRLDAWRPAWMTDSELEHVSFERTDDEIEAALKTSVDDHAGIVMGGKWETSTRIVLIRCDASWEAAARLGFGGWNNCPEPSAQAAFHRYFHETAQFSVCGIGSASLLGYIGAPPSTPRSTIALARGLLRYCDDLKLATDEVGLAKAIAAGPAWWSFWWD